MHAGLDQTRLLCNAPWLKYIIADCALFVHVSIIQHRQLIRLRRCSHIAYIKICAIGMKKGNKQCLFDTPRTVVVNKENEIRKQRPWKYAKSRLSHESAHLIQVRKMSKFTKLPFCQKLFFQHQTFHANFQWACNMKAKYKVNPSKAVIEVDRPMYALS